MAEFLATTASNSPKVRDAAAVERVLAGYFVDPDFHIGVNYDHDTGEPYLFLYGFVWPEAWPLPEGMSPQEFDPYTEDTFPEGAQGFTQLLKALAPHLTEPLTVHAIGAAKCSFPLSAMEWHIAAGSKRVKVTEFRHSSREMALVG
jgi:hypothetical protein